MTAKQTAAGQAGREAMTSALGTAPRQTLTANDYDESALLLELEPEAARLLDRHEKVAQEWFPHDFIPYRLGRDFDKEP